MQVSFLIPLHNCLPLTQAMLASLRATLPPGLAHEIIFVDDGSTDGTREWLATLPPPCRVILHDRNLGYAAANNHAAAAATGETLALLNNDLVLRPGWLPPLLAALRSSWPSVGVAGNIQLTVATGAIDHAGIYVTEKAKIAHLRELPRFRRPPFSSLRRVAAVTGACLVIRRALWAALGGFDEQFLNGAEDVDLCLRARSLGFASVVALRSVVLHHVSSSPGRKLHDERNSLRLASKWRHVLPEIAHESHREWCRDFLAGYARDPHNADLQRTARHAFFHLARLRPAPPPDAVAAIAQHLGREFARWETLRP